MVSRGVGWIFILREERTRRIPGLLFADDMILMSHTWKDMEALLEITTRSGEEKNLAFNPAKSAVVAFRTAGNDKDKF